MDNITDENKDYFFRENIVHDVHDDVFFKPNDSCDNSFEMIALYRSLYIIKRKFEIYKNDIMEIYGKYSINQFDFNNSTNHYLVKIEDIDLISFEIFEHTHLCIIQIYNPKDIYVSNLYLNENRKNDMINILKLFKIFLSQNKNKYNQIFYDKKIKPFLNEEEENLKEENKNNEEEKESENTEEEIFKPIIKYDKLGNISKNYSQVLNENTKNKKILEKNETINYDNIIGKEKENIETFINNFPNKNIIYIEAFPFILGEFLQISTIYGIVETNNDLIQELNILFDKEILEKIYLFEKLEKERKYKETLNSPKGKEMIKYLNEKKRIEQNIKIYEKILLEKKEDNKNIKLIQEMLEKLLAQKIWIEQKIENIKEPDLTEEQNSFDMIESKNKNLLKLRYLNNSNNEQLRKLNNSNSVKQFNKIRLSRQFSPLNKTINNIKNGTNDSVKIISKDEKRIKALKEIFDFYSNQHNKAGSTPLFSTIQEKKFHIDFSEFFKFCNEFSISLTKQKLNEVFKKNSSNFYTMVFNEFVNTIDNLSLIIHENKKNFILKKITDNQEKLNLLEIKENFRLNEEKKEILFLEKNTGNKSKRNLEKNQFIYLSKKKKIDEEISTLKYQLDNLNKKSNKEIKESFYELLGLNQKLIYRKKMIGFNNLPFQMHDQSYRTNNNNYENKIEENNEIKKLIEAQKAEKEKILLSKKLINNNLIYQNRIKSFQEKNKKLELHAINRQKEKKYSNLMKERILETRLKEEEKRNKVSWNKLNQEKINKKDKKYLEELYDFKDEEKINKSYNNNNLNNQDKRMKRNFSALGLVDNDSHNQLPLINIKRPSDL